MREEKRSQIATQGFERETRKGTVSFIPSSNQKQKGIPNRRAISDKIIPCYKFQAGPLVLGNACPP